MSDEAVDKAGGTVNGPGTEMIRSMARAMTTATAGASAPAQGVRPDPGALPDPKLEAADDPLKFMLPWGGNLSYTPRTGYGTPFSILRGLASTSPIAFMCIQCRKDQMAALDWGAALKDKAKNKKRGDDVDQRVAGALAILNKPDGVTDLKTWLQMAVDEILTIDALSVYRRPTVKGAALRETNRAYELKPDEIFGYEIIDGATIKVLLDGRGNVPLPPDIAYRQIIYGAPVKGGDLTRNELMYLPKTIRTWTPYGFAPLEAALLIILAEIQRDVFNLSYYSEGNIPEALVGVPDSWGPTQIAQWNQYWDVLMKGDPKNRSRLRFVTQTMAKAIHEFKKADFTTAWDLHILKLICGCFGVTPSEIGFTDDVNKATSKSQGDVNQRRGVKPMAGHLKSMLDLMLAEKGYPDCEVTWSGGEGEDALTQERIMDIRLRNGRMSLDELRQMDGNPTLGAGPAIITMSGPIFWEQAVADMKAAGLENTGGDEDPDVPEGDLIAEPDSGTEPGDDADPVAVAQDAELKKYRTVAMKAVRAGRPVPSFRSQVLPPNVLRTMAAKLADASSATDVQRVFDIVQKSQRLSASQKRNQRQMATKLAGVLAKERKALVKHVTEGLHA